MSRFQTLNFKKWIDEHRHLLKPPVGNRQIWSDTEFLVTVVGGPNSRLDYHIDEGEEYFHQLEGDMTLKLVDDGKFIDLPIREGEIFLLPPRVPHSPQRPAGTVGLVIERRRRPGELDGFVWYCPDCRIQVHAEFIQLKDIVLDLPPVFEKFYGTPALCTCKRCGKQIAKSTR